MDCTLYILPYVTTLMSVPSEMHFNSDNEKRQINHTAIYQEMEKQKEVEVERRALKDCQATVITAKHGPNGTVNGCQLQM